MHVCVFVCVVCACVVCVKYDVCGEDGGIGCGVCVHLCVQIYCVIHVYVCMCVCVYMCMGRGEMVA